MNKRLQDLSKPVALDCADRALANSMSALSEVKALLSNGKLLGCAIKEDIRRATNTMNAISQRIDKARELEKAKSG